MSALKEIKVLCTSHEALKIMSPGREVSFERNKGKAQSTTKTKMVMVGVALVQQTGDLGPLSAPALTSLTVPVCFA